MTAEKSHVDNLIATLETAQLDVVNNRVRAVAVVTMGYDGKWHAAWTGFASGSEAYGTLIEAADSVRGKGK